MELLGCQVELSLWHVISHAGTEMEKTSATEMEKQPYYMQEVGCQIHLGCPSLLITRILVIPPFHPLHPTPLTPPHSTPLHPLHPIPPHPNPCHESLTKETFLYYPHAGGVPPLHAGGGCPPHTRGGCPPTRGGGAPLHAGGCPLQFKTFLNNFYYFLTLLSNFSNNYVLFAINSQF